MTIPIASLGGTDLPAQFRYRLYVPDKRNSITETNTTVVVQSADPQIVHGSQLLAWTVEAAKPTEFQSLWDLYNTATPTLYNFSGYWGESFRVYFTKFDHPSVSGRLMSLSGSFQVIEVTSWYNALCNP